MTEFTELSDDGKPIAIILPYFSGHSRTVLVGNGLVLQSGAPQYLQGFGEALGFNVINCDSETTLPYSWAQV